MIAVAVLSGWASASSADNVRTLPALTLTVIDEKSEKPLPGITVHYMVERETHWTVFPLTIEAHIKSEIAAAVTATTDENGVVVFDNIKVALKSYWLQPKAQRIDSELLFINLDPLSRWPHYKSHYTDKYEYLRSTIPFFEDLDRPNPTHLGYMLHIAKISEGHGREEEFATVRFEPDSFDGNEKRSYVARLKPIANNAPNKALQRDAPQAARP